MLLGGLLDLLLHRGERARVARVHLLLRLLLARDRAVERGLEARERADVERRDGLCDVLLPLHHTHELVELCGGRASAWVRAEGAGRGKGKENGRETKRRQEQRKEGRKGRTKKVS